MAHAAPSQLCVSTEKKLIIFVLLMTHDKYKNKEGTGKSTSHRHVSTILSPGFKAPTFPPIVYEGDSGVHIDILNASVLLPFCLSMQ